MGGGLIQLITIGIQDSPLVLNPEITFFKIVYKRYTNFSIQQNFKNLGLKNFGSNTYHKLDKSGDLLAANYLVFHIPYFQILKTTVDNSLLSQSYDLNKLAIIYGRDNSLMFYYNNSWYLIPESLFNLTSFTSLLGTIDSHLIQPKFLPDFISIDDLGQNVNLITIQENELNPIISILRICSNTWEEYWLNLATTNIDDYEFYNKIIDQINYIKEINNSLQKRLFDYFNNYNNININKKYFNFCNGSIYNEIPVSEISQYIKYLTTSDPSSNIIKYGFDADLVYKYVNDNNLLDQLDTYQLNDYLYNPLIILFLLYNIYPSSYNTFTFWKKYNLNVDNSVDKTINNNTYNTRGEWLDNFNRYYYDANLVPDLISQLFSYIEKQYNICEQNIIQLFNTLDFNNPENIFISLSSFMIKYLYPSQVINFNDYYDLSSNTTLNNAINNQFNNYFTLEKNVSKIDADGSPYNETNSIFPVDMSITFPYLAYKLIDNIINEDLTNDYTFLRLWRNKINSFTFLKNSRFYDSNKNLSDLYDTNQTNRKLTFFVNLDLQNYMTSYDFKKYFYDMFYSSSLIGSIDLNDTEFTNFKNTLNPVTKSLAGLSFTLGNNQGYFHELKVNDTFTVSDISYNLTNNTILVKDWTNNINLNLSFNIDLSGIIYDSIKCSRNNDNKLLLEFNSSDFKSLYDSSSTSLILNSTYQQNIPLVMFYNSAAAFSYPQLDVNSYELFKKVNGLIEKDYIVSEQLFNIPVNDLSGQTCLFTITNNDETINRYLVKINSFNNYYQVTDYAGNKININKDLITNLKLDTINFNINVINSINGSNITNNVLLAAQITGSYTYNANNVYWLINENNLQDCVPLIYDGSGNFNLPKSINPENIYNISFIQSSNVPNFMLYLREYYSGSQAITNGLTDLDDYIFQTPMIFLTINETGTINSSTFNSLSTYPLLYFYNIPYRISSISQIKLDNKTVTSVAPLVANQFFKNTTSSDIRFSPVFDLNILQTDLSGYMYNINQQMNDILNTPDFNKIVNIIDQSYDFLLNMYNSLFNTRNDYGLTTNKIIDNLNEINTIIDSTDTKNIFDVINYNNQDFENFSHFLIDISSNENESNAFIQNLSSKYIKNYPLFMYKSSEKLSENTVTYLKDLPTFFQNNIDYINSNNDYLLITNEIQYSQSFINKEKIIDNIYEQGFVFDSTNVVEPIYPINDLSGTLYSIILNDTSYNFVYDSSGLTIYNYSDQQYTEKKYFKTETYSEDKISIDNLRFNNLGWVYVDVSGGLSFINTLDGSGYNFIQKDDLTIKPFTIDEFGNYTISNNNEYLLNSNFVNFDIVDVYSLISISGPIYYYKLDLNQDISSIYNTFIFDDVNITIGSVDISDNSLIEIFSNVLINFDSEYKTLLTGYYPISNILNDIKSIELGDISSFNQFTIQKFNIMNHSSINRKYLGGTISGEYIIDISSYIPTNKVINYNGYSLFDISSTDIISYNTISKIIPPSKIYNNNIYALEGLLNTYSSYSDDVYVKLNHGIVKKSDLINVQFYENNYNVWLLPQTNLDYVQLDISGTITELSGINYLTFASSPTNIPSYSYYLINGCVVFIKDISSSMILEDFAYNYYTNGTFGSIGLINNGLFKENLYPLIKNYSTSIDVNELYLSGIYNDYKSIIEPEFYAESNVTINGKQILDLSNETIRSYGSDEIIVNLVFTISGQQILRPTVVKEKISWSPKPIINFIETSVTYNNSFIVHSGNPTSLIGSINLNGFTGTIKSTSPKVDISNNDLVFISTSGIEKEKIYNWKLQADLSGNSYPLNFWSLFTDNSGLASSYLALTGSTVTEPLLLDPDETLFTTNFTLNKSSPDIVYQDSTNIKLKDLTTTIDTNYKYYIQSYLTDLSNYNLEISPYNFHASDFIKPKLRYWKQLVDYDNTKIYIGDISSSFEYLLIFDLNQYEIIYLNQVVNNYITPTKTFSEQISIMFSTVMPTFVNNEITILKTAYNKYIISGYQYNNNQLSEIICINDVLFYVNGQNVFTGNYELTLIDTNQSINDGLYPGYYSYGSITRPDEKINFVPIEQNHNMVYESNPSLNDGDAYYYNGNIKIYDSETLSGPIFTYEKTGTNIEVFVKDLKYYILNDLFNVKINQILVYSGVIYTIISIKDREIFFNTSPGLSNGFYQFYYPYQPYSVQKLTIDSSGSITPYLAGNSWDQINDNTILLDSSGNTLRIENGYIAGFTPGTKNYKVFNLDITTFYDKPFIVPTTDVPVMNNCDYCIQIKCDLSGTNKLFVQNSIENNYTFFLYQPIRINSCSNFINDIYYDSSSFVIETRYDINLDVSNNLDVVLSPYIINKYKYYSFEEVDYNNYITYPSNIHNKLISSYLISNDSNNLLNVLTDLSQALNGYINFRDNYFPIDLSGNLLDINLKLNGNHILLEKTKYGELITHLCEIVYPFKFEIYTQIQSYDSTFYLDKIYPVVFDSQGNIRFKNPCIYQTKQMIDILDTSVPLYLFYKYPVFVTGVPEYENNIYKTPCTISGLLPSIDEPIEIYLTNDLSANILSYTIDSSGFTFIESSSYIGNNIQNVFIRKENYVKSITSIDKNWLSDFTNHEDNLEDYLTRTTNKENIKLPVQLIKDSFGDVFKYKLYQSDSLTSLSLDISGKYNIGDLHLPVYKNFYSLQYNQSYILTQTEIPVDTQIYDLSYAFPTNVYIQNDINSEVFNTDILFKSVPETLLKLKYANEITDYMLYNELKPWTSWSILGASSLDPIPDFLNKGKIIYSGGSVIQDASNIYFTNDELDYFTNLLTQINVHTELKPNIFTLQEIETKIFNEIKYWIKDNLFLSDPIKNINNFLNDNNYTDISFNGNYFIFDNELPYIDSSSVFLNNERLLYVSNQYTIDPSGLQIGRDMSSIYVEIGDWISKDNQSNYGVNINHLCKFMVTLGSELNDLNTSFVENFENTPNYSYNNPVKFLINKVWEKYYKTDYLKPLVDNFNYKLDLSYNILINNSDIQLVSGINFDSHYNVTNFGLNSLDILTTLNYSEETNLAKLGEYNLVINEPANETVKLISNPLFPYKISIDKNIIIDETIYQIDFLNGNFSLTDPYIPDPELYPNQINFNLDINTIVQDDIVIQTYKDYTISGYIYNGKNYRITFTDTLTVDELKSVASYIYKGKECLVLDYVNTSIIDIAVDTDISGSYFEFDTNVGIMNYTVDSSSNTILEFYQDSFIYIPNQTFIQVDNQFTQLFTDGSNYYVNYQIDISSGNAVIKNMVNYTLTESFNQYVYSVTLLDPFKYYNDYIRLKSSNLETNFEIDGMVPKEITFIDNTNFWIITDETNNTFNTLKHYSRLEETPPNEITKIEKLNTFLFSINESLVLANNASIRIYDISNSGVDVSGGIFDLSNSYIEYASYFDTISGVTRFTTSTNFTFNELHNDEKLMVLNHWTISGFILENDYVIFNYPPDLVLNTKDNYWYTIEDTVVDKSQILVDNSNNIQFVIDVSLNSVLSTLSSFDFKQIYMSPNEITLPDQNQLVSITYVDEYQYDASSGGFYLMPFDYYGSEYGSYLYQFTKNIDISENIFNLYTDKNYDVKLLFIDSSNIIIGSQEEITITGTPYITLPLENRQVVIDNLTYYQKTYQKAIFNNQEEFDTIEMFVNSEINEIDMSGQITNNRYYFISRLTTYLIDNLFNNNNQIEQDPSMVIKSTYNNLETTSTEEVKWNSPSLFASEASFYIEDQLIERINPDTGFLQYYYYLNAEMRNQLSKVIKIIDMGSQGWQITIPLHFWYNKRSGVYVPLVALPYNDLYIKFNINKLENLILNDLSGATYSTKPVVRMELIQDSVLLDTYERMMFGKYQHEYIIERYNVYPSNLVYLTEQTVQMNFRNLIKDIFWITQPIEHLNNTSYQIPENIYDSWYSQYLTISGYYSEYSTTGLFTSEITRNYSKDFDILRAIDREIILGSARINRIKTSPLLNEQDLRYTMYLEDKYLTLIPESNKNERLVLYYSQIYKNQIKYEERSPIKEITMRSNGNQLFQGQNWSYYTNVVAYQKFNGAPPLGYYAYSFSLNPTQSQPSGHLNFNMLDNIVLSLVNDSQVTQEPFNLKTIVKEYQILRVMSGMAGLAWT